jgi:hypothetical protein
VTSSRFSIPSSAIDSQSSVVIPLQVFPAYNSLEFPQGPPPKTRTKNPIYKAGIQVAVTPSGETAPLTNLYEFDTGGKGFFAGNAPMVTPPNPVGAGVANAYTSGISYSGAATYATIAFPDATPPLTLPDEMLVGIITSVAYPGAAAPQLPIFKSVDGSIQLFGDFGMSLAAGTAGVPANNHVPLLSVLAQLASRYGGFIVDVGAYPPGNTPARVILGLTPQLIGYFPNVFPMNTGATYQPQDPPPSQANLPPVTTFSPQLLTGTLQVGQQSFHDVPIVFDTGAPQTAIHNLLPPGTSVSGQVILTVTDGTNSCEVLNFTAGDEPGLNAVSVQGEPGSGSPAINTGLAPFFANPILFDLQNGRIGFV